MKTRMRSDDTNENSYLQPKNYNEENRKIIDYDNSNTLLSNDNNKIYVEEIQLNELMDSNAKYIISEHSNNIQQNLDSSKPLTKSKKDPIISEIIENVL